MKPLNSIEIKLCQKQGKIFEKSVKQTNYSSLVFIRRFMYSSIAKSMDDKIYLFTSNTEDDALDIINDQFKDINYGKEKYTEDEMFWIGYIYRVICIKYNLSSKYAYKLFNAKDIIKYFNICHTFDIIDAAERMMESINYDNSTIEEKAYKEFKKLMYQERLNEYLGKNIKVTINKNLNSGYFTDLKTPNNKYQNVYVIGVKKPIKEFEGKVIAIINRIDEIENILVVSYNNKKYTKEEILKLINYEDKKYKSKITLA